MIGQLGNLGHLGMSGGSRQITLTGTATITAGALTLTIGLAITSGTAYIDAGDGRALIPVTYTGEYQNYTITYASAGTYTVKLIGTDKIKSLRLVAAQLAMSISSLQLTYLHLYGTGNSVTGVLPSGLTYLLLYGTGSSVTGVLPSGLTSLYLSGTGNSVTGVLPSGLTSLYLYGTGNSVTGVLPSGLTYLFLYGTGSSVTGVLPSGLTSLYLSGTGNSVTGVLPSGLTYLYLSGTGSSVTGVLPSGLTYLFLSGTGNSVTGVLPSGLTYLLLSGTGTSVSGSLGAASRLQRMYIAITGVIDIPTSGLTLGTVGSEGNRIEMGTGMIAAQSTAILAAFRAAPKTTGSKSLWMAGNNAAPTTYDDADYLTALGWTISTN